MGAKLSLLAPSAPTVALSSYIDVLDNIQYIELINNSRFLKTIKAIDLNTGDALIIKILIKPNNAVNSINIDLQQYTELMVKEASLLSQFNCFLPNNRFIETDRTGYLIRQLVKTNLYDRLSIRPFLEPIEKKFITFQLLKMVDILHNHLHIRHGDLKLENIMVSSSNWIMLTDFASYLKPAYIPEDNPNQFSFYFDTSDRRVCNLAPERFYNSRTGLLKPQNFDESDSFVGSNQITKAMDLFSLGCILGELYMDGEPLFTLSALFKHLKNEYTPDLAGIDDPEIKEIILKLILFDPEKRTPVEELLSSYKNSYFPPCFYTYLYDFLKNLNDFHSFQVKGSDDNVTSSDLRINYIYENFESIIQNLRFNFIHDPNTKGMKLNLPGMPQNYKIRSTFNFKNPIALEQSALIILNVIFSLMNTLKQPSSKIKACEMIVALSERVNDSCKLDRSLPYLCSLIDDYIKSCSSRKFDSLATSAEVTANPGVSGTLDQFNDVISSKVVVTALDAITTLLNSCSYVTPLNVSMTSEYLLPKLKKLMVSDPTIKENELVKIKLASCLPFIAEISHKFWLMSKTFKVVSNGNKSEDNPDIQTDNYLISRNALHNIIEEITSLVLTDSNPKVRSALVENIEPLCRFFGVEKTNDIILPHLITYLNDQDNELKLSFLNSILFLGPYVGVLSFEQYLLPLLIQTLCDAEQSVVLEVLEIFVKFVSRKLINPSTEFNALNIYKELLTNTIHLLLHPNEWIRQSVIDLILSINDNLLNADRFCFLYPQIKSYLSYDITTISWDTLYPCLTKPLTKLMYQILLSWANSHSEKSLFWKQEGLAMMSSSKFTTFTKDLGKSVFVPSKYSVPNLSPSKTSIAQLSVPLSHDDKQWLLKLKSVGLDDKNTWKIFYLKNYILQVSRGMVVHGAQSVNSFQTLELVDITPRNVFFDISYKSEIVTAANKGTSTNIEYNTIIEDTKKTERSESNQLVLPTFSKVTASIQANEENVFAELEVNNDHNGHAHVKQPNKTNNKNEIIAHKVISSNSEKVIMSSIRHSYQGHNQYILNYLQNVDFDLSLSSFPEFGEPVKSRHAKVNNWDPKGTLISQINANGNPGIPDSLTSIAINPTSEFFVTGSEMGALKVWDTQKLEKNVMFKNASLSGNFKSAIERICFMNNRNILAVSTRDGKVRVFKVEFTRGKTKKIVRYSKLALIRKYELTEEYATMIMFHDDISLIMTTSKSRIISLNVINMEIEFLLENPLIHGVPTSLIVDTKKCWLLLGTNKGRICLWDIRFSVLVKTMKVKCKDSKDGYPISQLLLLPSYKGPSTKDDSLSYFAMMGGTAESDVTIWEIPTFECREVLCSQDQIPKIKQFQMEEIKKPDDDIEDILNDLTLDLNHDYYDTDIYGTITSFMDSSYYYIIHALPNGRIVFWNLHDIEKSNSTEKLSTFTRNEIAPKQGLTYQNVTGPKPKSTQHDIINDICVSLSPAPMILTVDRAGILNLLT